MKLAGLSAIKLKQLLDDKEIGCVEIMQSVLEEIEIREAIIRAFITLRPKEELLDEASAVDRRRRRGETIGPLAGLPVAVKDNLCTKSIRTTCASRMLANFYPPYNASVIDKVIAAGGIIVGKTNLDEFSMGSTTENSAMQITRNPWNTNYVPGGTSGGSAAALAANEAVLALGSDTGGSIRQPASYCGVVGLKPTYGRVSRFGLIPYASSLDHVGVLGRVVADAALLFSVVAGHDPNDSTSLQIERNAIPTGSRTKKPRVGVPTEFFEGALDSEVKQAVENTIAALRSLGSDVVSISLPHTTYAIPTYYIIASAEASSNLARFDGCKFGHRSGAKGNIIDVMTASRTEGFGAEVKRRIILGTYVLSAGYYEAYYSRAVKVKRLTTLDYENAYSYCDIIVHPVAPTPAFEIGEKIEDPLSMYLVDIYSVSANLTGMPAISIPCGFSSRGLPIGAQLTGPPLSEGLLLGVAQQLENFLQIKSHPDE